MQYFLSALEPEVSFAFNQKALNVPGTVKGNESKIEDFEFRQYKSFTVKADKQTNENTLIEIVNTTDVWSKERLTEYKNLKYNWGKASINDEKELLDLLVKDFDITCTVKYKDGSTETKKVKINNKIMRPSEAGEKNIPKEKDKEMLFELFSIK